MCTANHPRWGRHRSWCPPIPSRRQDLEAGIQLARDLDPYLVTSHHDDEAGVLQTYSFRRQLGVMHLPSGSPVIVGIVDVLLCGVVAAVATQAPGGAVALQVASDCWLCSGPEWCSALSVTEGLHSFGATCGRGSRAESSRRKYAQNFGHSE